MGSEPYSSRFEHGIRVYDRWASGLQQLGFEVQDLHPRHPKAYSAP